MSDGMVFCRACGATIHSSAPLCPKCGAPQSPSSATGLAGDGIPRTFGNAISICFRKYVVFTGRAPRAEYWWFALLESLISLPLLIFMTVMLDLHTATLVTDFVGLLLLLPALAVAVRRLHDLDKSGWWLLILLIPLVGPIILLVWNCTRGTRGENRFGPENGLV